MTAQTVRDLLAVSVAGIALKTPFIGASGTFGNGEEFDDFVDWDKIGGVCVKGLTLEVRNGNRGRRMAETAAGMMNCVGLQNPGIHAFVRDILPRIRRSGTAIIVNINGNTVEDYAAVTEVLQDADIDGIEVNISCPNTKHGCMAFGVDPVQAAAVTSIVKRYARVPVIVKLSPNVTDIALIAQAVEEAGADAISLINTLLGMAIDTRTWRPVLGNVTGGLSGPAVKPIALRMVYQAAQAVKVPIIGLGGIASAMDAVEFFLAGASAVQVGTANFVNPRVMCDMADDLSVYLTERGLTNVSQLVGKMIIDN